MSSTAIVLAAGTSTRMGQMKGLLAWGNVTLFEHVLQELEKAAIDEIIVVVGHQAEKFIRLAKKYHTKIVYNAHYHHGKCSSILAGLTMVRPNTNTILITSVDQPTHSSIVHALIAALHDHSYQLAIPVNHKKRGHPILFSAKILPDLFTIKEETKGLRHIIQKYQNQLIEVEVHNPLISLNLNTMEDYKAARAQFDSIKEVF